MNRILNILVIIMVLSIFGLRVESATQKTFLTEEEVQESAKFIDEPEDVQKARYYAFKNVVWEIDPKTFEKYLVDKKFIAPPKKQGGRPKLKPRFGMVEVLSTNVYIVLYFENHLYSYTYSTKDGKLMYFSIFKYDRKNDIGYSYDYDVEGKLKYIYSILTIDDGKTNGYLFGVSKNFIGKFEKSTAISLDNKIVYKSYGVRFFK